MSKLVRMNLSGIRSFGPEENDRQSIKFQSPLTLIQGQNGCGKTTIIEALKFAVTGELPAGCSKGQSFVYDPKLARVYESRGQVKLLVFNTKSEPVTVTKSVMVTQRATKMEFKRLDSTISRKDANGEVHHVSNKCAEIDSEMCMVLGVSKSILNNVIFCHQEDSNWPLGEDKKLKEHFDEIFDATKYNKCLDSFTKFLRGQEVHKKLLERDVTGCLDIKNFVARKQEEKNDKETRLNEIQIKITEVDSQFEPINKRVTEVDDLEKVFNTINSDYQFKCKELKNLTDQQNEILLHIVEFDGTDEELKNKRASFETDVKSIHHDIEVLEMKRREIEQNEHKLRSNINEEQKQLGRLQAEEKQNETNETNRNELIKQSLNKFDIKSIMIDSNTSNEGIKLIISDLNQSLNDKKQEIQKSEKQFEDEEKSLQNSIDSIREKCVQLKGNINSKQKQLADLKNESGKVKNQLQEINTANQQLKLVEEKLNRLEKETASLELRVDVDSIKAIIDQEKQKLNNLEDQLSKIDSEVQTLQRYATIQEKIDMNKENNINKQNEYEKLMNKHEKTFQSIFPDGIPADDLKPEIVRYQKIQTLNVKTLNKKLSEKQTEITKLETSLNMQRDKLKEQESELELNRKEISIYCPDGNLDALINQTNTDIEKLQKNRYLYSTSKYLYEKFISNFQSENPCCPICKRNVEEAEYSQEIIKTLQTKIENVPNEVKKHDISITETQTKYNRLLNLKPKNKKMLQLETDVPKLREHVSDLDTKLIQAKSDLNELQKSILEPQKREELANGVIGDASLIDQYRKDLSYLKDEIDSLTSRLPNQDLRSIEEALSEQETLKINIRNARNQIDSQQTIVSKHTERLNKQKEERNNLVAQQLQMKQHVQNKENLLTKRDELNEKMNEFESDLNQYETQVEPLETELKKSIENKNVKKQTHRDELNRNWSEFNDLKKIVNNITTLQNNVEEFYRKNISEQIENVNKSIGNYQTELKTFSDKKTKITNNVDKLKETLTNQKVRLREFDDNLKLRQKRIESKKLESKIKELEDQLGEQDIRTIRKEKENLINQKAKLYEEKHKAEGKRDELLKSIEEVNKELKLPIHANAAVNYKRKYLELELCKRATMDLKQFLRAMNWALIQFHKQRMVQINNIIKELWQSIYKGNDCDYIEIKTEDASQGTDRRKVYNYRVVQVKNNVEMDMRGRCSAGQKVLAALLIRIALADTFSSNCGILALDEPTTNLDRHNIKSLSDALIQLISQKRQQKNFQLLIITHDQEFVDSLTRMESLEHYYVVQRNEEGKSTITIQRR